MKHPKDGSFHPSFILKLQTARFRTLGELQTRDLVENDRLDVLYLPMGGLGGQKRQKTPENPKKLFSPEFLFLKFSAPIEPLWALRAVYCE